MIQGPQRFLASSIPLLKQLTGELSKHAYGPGANRLTG